MSTAQQTDTLLLNEVEISATKSAASIHDIPASVNVLLKKDIQALNSTISIDEALRQVPGLFINNRYNFSQGERISIRGLGSRAQYGVRSIKILLDGVPLTFPDGTTQLNNLDLSSVGKIEVLRGPAASIYGNASGGVIALYTENPSLNYTILEPGLIAGSDGLLKANLKFTTASKRSQFILNGSTTSYQGHREFSAARLYNLNSIYKWYPNETTVINFIVNAMHAPYMYNPGGISKEALVKDPLTVRPIIKRQVASKSVTQAQAGIHIKKGIGNGEFNSTIYGIKRDLYNPIFGRIIEVDRYSIGSRNSYRKNILINGLKFSVTGGSELEFQKDGRKEFENLGVSDEIVENTPITDLIKKANKGDNLINQTESIYSLGAFALADLEINPNLSLAAGARFDYQDFKIKNKILGSGNGSGSVSFHQFSPSIGLVYDISIQFNYYLNFSTAFQTPTANEFSNDPSGSGFNQDLLPERVKNLETGIRKSGAKLEAEWAVFHLIINNQLIPYQISTTSDEMFFRNAGKATNSGMELWLQYEPIKDLYLKFSYTYMHYIFTDYVVETPVGAVQLKNMKVPGVPDHKLYSGIKKEFNFGLITEAEIQYISNYFTNDFNGPAPGESGLKNDFINENYFITDLSAGYEKQIRKIKFYVFAGINNVFNNKYSSSIIPNAAGNRFFEPAPGRNFYLGIKLPYYF